MTETACHSARAALWRSTDPFAGLPTGLFQTDLRGWNSLHPYLSDGIERMRPRFVVEVGVWKGTSALFMASKLKQHEIDGVVIAIDTWLGSWEHWFDVSAAADLSFDRGYPRLYDKFSANVVACDLQDHVVPLPLDSGNAAVVIDRLFPPVDMIHLDAAHDYASVAFDLTKWWAVLRPGGLFIGDDYYPDTHWPEVKAATDHFLAGVPHEAFECGGGKWRAIKK